MPSSPTARTPTPSPWHTLVWLLPGLVAVLLMVFAPELVEAVCPRELKAAKGCAMLFPPWTFWVLALVAAASVAWTVRTWRRAAKAASAS